MRRLVFCLLFAVSITALAQSTPDKKAENSISEKSQKSVKKSDDSFGDYVKKAGLGIWRRIKVRFNLDQRGQEIKRKSQQIFKKSQTGENENVDKIKAEKIDSLKVAKPKN